MKHIRSALALVLVFLTACSGLLSPGGPLSTQALPTPTSTASPTPSSTQAPAATISPSGPVTLRIWLPPQFDPSADTQAGELLSSRLEAFGTRRPGVRIEVRLKAIDGPGGLLDSLTTASAAAPLALPDLVALPRQILETAALKGLLHPYEGLTTVMDDPDWFEYARQLARLQNSTFGMPFAGDALVLTYRTTVVQDAPVSWPAVMTAEGPLAFAAADPQALFTLALYQAAGGAVRDDQGRPTLDGATLEQVLAFYQEAETNERMPFWLAQFQNDDQVWEALQDQRANMAVSWASRFFTEPITNSAIAPIPTQEGTPFTLANGWVWAVASPQLDRQRLSAQLAEFLTESSFLAEFDRAAGFLPPRPGALEAWPDTPLKPVINQIALSASLYPSTDVLTSLGPAFMQATLEVLKQQSDPQTAAKAAVEALKGP